MTDIEQALAEALVTGIDYVDEYADEAAAAILATPQMQAIARQAAIGAAVERVYGWTIDSPALPPAIAAALGEATK